MFFQRSQWRSYDFPYRKNFKAIICQVTNQCFPLTIGKTLIGINPAWLVNAKMRAAGYCPEYSVIKQSYGPLHCSARR